eukprot:12417296-Karenia_brevis.AAC.1
MACSSPVIASRMRMRWRARGLEKMRDGKCQFQICKKDSAKSWTKQGSGGWFKSFSGKGSLMI